MDSFDARRTDRACPGPSGEVFEVVQREVAALLKGRVLVGHAVYNDLKVLMLSHPKKHTRDTARSALSPVHYRIRI